MTITDLIQKLEDLRYDFDEDEYAKELRELAKAKRTRAYNLGPQKGQVLRGKAERV